MAIIKTPKKQKAPQESLRRLERKMNGYFRATGATRQGMPLTKPRIPM
ncbi:hypothetical protein GW781_02095 [bacterium]|nr:hypothetical protein [bacterium]NCT19928.1 hypothetical protein [bacterium]